tara:strand:+ start:1595 stop:2125 length:531 start_codon:yes stop_codon:yes gene_type:complete
MTLFNKCFAMPNSETFKIKPIREFVEHWTTQVINPIIVDPFARNSKVGTITNDLNPDTDAMYHLKADAFLNMLVDQKIQADVVLYDPPYSPRQISECYSASGIKTTQQDTQSSFYTIIKNLIRPLVKPNGIVLSFGWNSMGVGKTFGKCEEVLLVNHGGAHNDTICVAQRKDRHYE